MSWAIKNDKVQGKWSRSAGNDLFNEKFNREDEIFVKLKKDLLRCEFIQRLGKQIKVPRILIYGIVRKKLGGYDIIVTEKNMLHHSVIC